MAKFETVKDIIDYFKLNNYPYYLQSEDLKSIANLLPRFSRFHMIIRSCNSDHDIQTYILSRYVIHVVLWEPSIIKNQSMDELCLMESALHNRPSMHGNLKRSILTKIEQYKELLEEKET